MLRPILRALAATNACTLRLMLQETDDARWYLSQCLRRYDELVGRGLAHDDPVRVIFELGWSEPNVDERVLLPVPLGGGGGTAPLELVMLARATRVLRPHAVFEIGTFNGLTTSIFIMNCPREATVFTLDLPPTGGELRAGNIKSPERLLSDVDLIESRDVGVFVRKFGLQDRYRQILCNSLDFDPAPYEGSIELGFIDGAHSLKYVQNDTVKMARMMADRGLVFWHDYGGQGSFLPLTEYLEDLGRRVPVCRINGTSLAWTLAADLKKALSP